MPLIDENALAKKLKAPLNDHLWLLFGDDDFLKEHYCKKLVDACVNEDLRFFNFHTYNDTETELIDIFADADNLPVMSEKTCLLVRNYPLCDLGDNQRKDFESRLKAVPDTTVMIFYYNTMELFDGKHIVSKWSETVDLFTSLGVAVNLSHRSQNKIAGMLVSRAPSRGTVISEAEAQYLVDTVGDDMQTLFNEFNKLCSYSCGQPITKQMIDEIAVKSIDANVFDISTAILSGKTDKAFAVTKELLRTKTPVQPIIGALAGTFVNLYRYKTAASAGHTYEELAAPFGYKGNYSYSFRQLSPYVSKIPAGSIREAVNILLETDTKTKSMAFDPTTLMSELIARLSQCCKTR